MAEDNFAACLAFTLRHEGGYADHPKDPGGATNFGVTHAMLARWRGAPCTKDDVRALTSSEAGDIYRKFYWDVVGAGALAAGLDAVAFDHAVHSGPRAAVKALQKALGVRADGVCGAATRAALPYADPTRTILAMCRSRRAFLARLSTYPTFGRGWMARIAALETTALAMDRAAMKSPKGRTTSQKKVNR